MRAVALAVVSVGLACAGAFLWVGAVAGRPSDASSLAKSSLAESSLAESSLGAAESDGLLNQRAEPFAMGQLRGKSVVLNFIFTHCPGICPLQTQALRRVRAELPEPVRGRVHFVSVSVDPVRDTPDALVAFAAKQGVDPEGWTFVTGPAQKLSALGESYSAQVLPAGAGPLDHRTEVRLINAEGRLMQTYTGNPLDEARLVREIQAVDGLFTPRASR